MQVIVTVRHLRQHYLGPLVNRQNAYNQLLYQAL